MEILSYVLEGGLAHKDSLGNGSVIRPGDLQYMSAGTGVRHSEFNASPTEPVHFMQIWIIPNAENQPPRYDQKRFEPESLRGRFRLVASESGADGSIAIRQDVRVYASRLDPGQSATLTIAPGRHLWAQVLRGGVDLDGHVLSQGDGLAASGQTDFRFAAGADPAELLAFDLA
jgi:redox-sensitive bicupin YhaK (pirin superfamily)